MPLARARHPAAPLHADISDAMAQALGVDMADWWQATTARFLQHVSKRTMLAPLREANGAEPPADMSAMKKAPLVLHGARLLESTRWLTAPLRPHKPDVSAREGEQADADIDERRRRGKGRRKGRRER